MSGGWQLFLFLFILGVVAQTWNTFGVPAWTPKYPSAQYTMDQSTIVSTQQSVKDSPISIFVIYTWVVQFFTIIGSGLVAVGSVGLFFYGMGWPVGIIGAGLLQLIQLPANLVIFSWMYELVTGRSIG